MIAEHINPGRFRYSSSPRASSAFLANRQPRPVCDFCALNNQTLPDMHSMGNIQDILHHAAWRGKLLFQTLMKEENIHETAITTLLGLLEWVVMP